MTSAKALLPNRSPALALRMLGRRLTTRSMSSDCSEAGGQIDAQDHQPCRASQPKHLERLDRVLCKPVSFKNALKELAGLSGMFRHHLKNRLIIRPVAWPLS